MTDPGRSTSRPEAEAGTLPPEKVKAALEALLLVSSEPLSPRRAGRILGLTETEARTCLELLAEDWRRRGGGLEIVEVGGGFRLVTRPEYDEYVAKLEPSRVKPPLTQAAVETLAIIAYRQPVRRADIERVRGVRCEGVLGTLLERGLIEEVGRADGPGRPILYGTTKRFLEFFGLRDLSELPPLPEADALRNDGEGRAEGGTP
ncbi:MAG TPA: SMC-Scp complex subunit ScpB [Clostridiales bacterium]|nr:SMC-Scp complex subunit ScpB [Clostridiales bacterium]